MRESGNRLIRLGLIGGTFDPPHLAHLMMAEGARVRFDLDKVLFVPAGQPPHKSDCPVSDAEHRYAMTLLCTADNPAFEVSRIELERDEPSYSVHTLRRVRALYGPETGIHFIVGADEAFDLPRWYEADSLPDLATFLVAPRPGFDIAKLKTELPDRFFNALDFIPMAPIDISATDLRERVAGGQSIRYLVTGEVEAYIRKQGLYVKGSEL